MFVQWRWKHRVQRGEVKNIQTVKPVFPRAMILSLEGSDVHWEGSDVLSYPERNDGTRPKKEKKILGSMLCSGEPQELLRFFLFKKNPNVMHPIVQPTVVYIFSDSLGAGGRAYIYIHSVFCSFREIGIEIKNSGDERPLKIPILTCVWSLNKIKDLTFLGL